MGSNDDLKALVRTIPDFPKPGIQFRDISTLLLDGPGFAASIDRLGALARPLAPQLIVSIEARGFIFGAALAAALGLGLLPVRKPGKLPGATIGIDYALEYGHDRLEMHEDAVGPDMRVAVVDDLIATGGTALAAVSLLRQAGAVVTGALFVIDLPELGGAARLREAGVRVDSLMAFEGH